MSHSFEIDNSQVGGDLPQWEIGLSEFGDCSKCCYSYCCPCCALAEARTILDGSNWLVNCMCIGAAPIRWMMRTAYNVPGNAQDDCWKSTCCVCCVTNQLLQTAYARGRPNIAGVGPEYNIHDRAHFNLRPTQEKVYDGLYSFFCRPCAIGLALQTVGMPCWFGGCCVSPYGANSILRYHHRTKPDFHNEITTDWLIPAILLGCGSNTGQLSSTFANWAYTFVNLSEQNGRVGRNGWWYGLNCAECCSYSCNYCCSNSCACQQQDTGRYLMNVGDGDVTPNVPQQTRSPAYMPVPVHQHMPEQHGIPQAQIVGTFASPQVAVQHQPQHYHQPIVSNSNYVQAQRVMY